jgi:hypothetical protein
MNASSFRRWLPAIVALLIVAGGLFYATRLLNRAEQGPDPETVATASLQAMRAQNRLVPFSARFVAVVTSSQTRFGLSARKTLIMPGNVDYSLDLARLQPRDLNWDAATRTLTVTLPPVVPSAPQVEMTAIREYDSGGVLMALTRAEARLDAANRAAAQRQLRTQAQGAIPLKLARDAARNAIEHSFAMPLAAAGVQATVKARFADDPAPDDGERVDMSRNPADVIAGG